MRYQQGLLALGLLAVVASACKKDAEGTPPSVTIISPGNNTDLTVPDTLTVVVEVSGEQDVDNVAFTLSNTSGIPVIGSVRVTPTSNPARLEVPVPVVSESLLSGDYTLTVIATAGDASGKDYRTINLTAAPLRLRRVLVVGRPSATTVDLHVIDSTGTLSLANSVATDLAGAAASSADQTIALLGSVTGPLTVLRADGQQVAWQKPNPGNSGIPGFTAIQLGADGRYYVGSTDARTRGYNARTGSTERVMEIADGFRATATALVDDRLVQAETDVTGTQRRIGIYQASSGAYVTQQALDKEVVALFARDDLNLLIFGNQGGQGVVEDRNVPGGGGWEPRTWPSRITAVEQLDGNTWLVALQSGAIERFTYSNAGSIGITTLSGVRDLSLDAVSGGVYVAAGNDVVLLNPQSGTTVNTWSIGTPVMHAFPLLNR